MLPSIWQAVEEQCKRQRGELEAASDNAADDYLDPQSRAERERAGLLQPKPQRVAGAPAHNGHI